MEQRTESWLAARCGRITASNFAAVMNVLKDGSPGVARRELVTRLAIERVTGQPADTFQNEAMRRGTELEPEARAAYEAFSGDFVETTGFILHPQYDFIGCSPDGLIDDDDMVEFKCPASMSKHMDALLRGDHATEYKWQIQGQMWVCNRKRNTAVSYDPRFPEPIRLALKTVERDEVAIKALEKECIAVNAEVEAAVADMRKLMEAA